MKRLLLLAFAGVFALPGCIVAVESRSHRVVRHDPPPPHEPEPEVTVEWTSARTVVMREYYDCDWETVGYFDYYERECGIPEDDLFFLLHVSRMCGRPFHEVVFTYSGCGRQLFRVVQHYRINHWDLYIDLPVGSACPPAYQRVYGYYWYRSRYPSIVLTNYDCHALFWLRFGTHYYGWQPRDCFTRWDRCVDNRVSFVTVVHREYLAPRRVVVHNWARRPVTVINKQDRDVRVIERNRTEVYKKVVVDNRQRAERGERIVVRPLPPQERERHLADQKREWEEERRREVEIRRKEPQKFEEYKRHDDNRKDEDRKTDRRDDDRKEDRKDKLDDRKDDRRDPPKHDPKEDDRKADRDNDRRAPPEKKSPPKEDKKDEPKRDDRNDDRKMDDRKKDEPKRDQGKKDDGKKDEPKRDDGKKDDRKKDDGRKDGGKNDGGKKKQSPPPQEQRRREPPRQNEQRRPQEQKQQKQQQQQRERAPERKQEQKQEQKKQEKPKDDRKQDRRR